jgi:predicted ATPase
LKSHPRIAKFRRFLENWYLSYFTPDAARSLPMAGPQKHLNVHGDNLGNVVQFMEREHKERFQAILNRIATKIPGIEKVIRRRQMTDGYCFASMTVAFRTLFLLSRCPTEP